MGGIAGAGLDVDAHAVCPWMDGKGQIVLVASLVNGLVVNTSGLLARDCGYKSPQGSFHQTDVLQAIMSTCTQPTSFFHIGGTAAIAGVTLNDPHALVVNIAVY